MTKSKTQMTNKIQITKCQKHLIRLCFLLLFAFWVWFDILAPLNMLADWGGCHIRNAYLTGEDSDISLSSGFLPSLFVSRFWIVVAIIVVTRVIAVLAFDIEVVKEGAKNTYPHTSHFYAHHISPVDSVNKTSLRKTTALVKPSFTDIRLSSCSIESTSS